jgi:hypothetical protein
MRITVLFAYIPLTYAGGKLNQLRTKANL